MTRSKKIAERHQYPVNVKVDVGGEKSPHKDKGKRENPKRTAVYPTKSPSIKKTTNKPGDPRIEEHGTWNSHRNANSGGRPVPSMPLVFSVRRIAGIVPRVVRIREVDRFYMWRLGFFLKVSRLT